MKSKNNYWVQHNRTANASFCLYPTPSNKFWVYIYILQGYFRIYLIMYKDRVFFSWLFFVSPHFSSSSKLQRNHHKLLLKQPRTKNAHESPNDHNRRRKPHSGLWEGSSFQRARPQSVPVPLDNEPELSEHESQTEKQHNNKYKQQRWYKQLQKED